MPFIQLYRKETPILNNFNDAFLQERLWLSTWGKDDLSAFFLHFFLHVQRSVDCENDDDVGNDDSDSCHDYDFDD